MGKGPKIEGCPGVLFFQEGGSSANAFLAPSNPCFNSPGSWTPGGSLRNAPPSRAMPSGDFVCVWDDAGAYVCASAKIDPRDSFEEWNSPHLSSPLLKNWTRPPKETSRPPPD